MARQTSSGDFGLLLGDLVDASKVPAKRRPVAIKSTVEKVTSLAYDHGVLPDDLGVLADLITAPSHLDQASLAALAKNLYPVGKVPDEVVLKIVGCLGHGKLKPSLAIQGLLLRWLILAYHVLHRQSVLSQAYAVLFNLLDTAALRSQICHILALITRRRHVRPFRIQAILNLSRQAGRDPSLIGLLRVYKNYYPEVIVGETAKGKASSFKHPDPQWRVRLDEIQTAHQQKTRDASDGRQDGFRVNHQLNRRAAGRNFSSVPVVHTSHAQENSVTLEEIETAESLVLNLDKIELPNQLVAVLADPLLQKFLLLRPEDEFHARVNNWLTACVSDIASGDASADELLDMLELVADYVDHIKTLPTVLLRLLQELFQRKVWDGVDRRDVILSALARSPLVDFDEAHQSTFQLLETQILDNTPGSQLALLKFYVALLRHWTVLLISFEDESPPADNSISQLILHVNSLCLTLVQTSPEVSTHMAILDFYEHVAAVISSPDMPSKVQITIPPPAVVYILHFSQSLAVTSRLYAVLAIYKKAFETSTQRSRKLSKYEQDGINVFNGFLMDICNCLWRARAFSNTDSNAVGCWVPQSLVLPLSRYISGLDRNLPLQSAFGLSHSPMLCLQSITCVRELEDAEMDEQLQKRHAGPVTQASLVQLGNDGGLSLDWIEYRSGVLRYLEEKGMGGLPELMYNTMKNLKSARAG